MVPGVCMLQIVKEVLDKHIIGGPTCLGNASNLKFLSLITPGDNPSVQLKLRYVQREQEVETQAELLNSQRIFFKMKATFIVQ